MREYPIPSGIAEVEEPKILGTNIPNLLGRAIITYENGMKKYVDLYYIQRFIKCILWVVSYPIKLLVKLSMRRRYKKYSSKYFHVTGEPKTKSKTTN